MQSRLRGQFIARIPIKIKHLQRDAKDTAHSLL